MVLVPWCSLCCGGSVVLVLPCHGGGFYDGGDVGVVVLWRCWCQGEICVCNVVVVLVSCHFVIVVMLVLC